EVVSKAATEASGDYIINIYDEDDNLVTSTTYATVKQSDYGIELLAGDYRLEVISGELPIAAFDTPVYGADALFNIIAGQKTDLESVICTILQCAATVDYDDALKEIMTGDGVAKVEVTSGYPLSYAVNYNGGNVSCDQRTGYFSMASGSNTMIVSFSGKVNGSTQKMTKYISGVKVGELRKIIFIKKVNAEGEATVDVTINGYVEDAELQAFVAAPQLDVIGEDPDAPKGDGGITLAFEPDCTMFSDLDNIVVPTSGTMDLRLVISCPGGIKKMGVVISSTSAAFLGAVEAAGGPELDLVNPSAESEVIFQVVPFPHGTDLLGATEVHLDLSAAQGPILGFSGTHTFTMKLTDNDNCRKEVAVTMIVQ
ncbi:MAG: DUF4493 domain-containing protein, partial [Bacteroidales bacterium]|nr:DUF4493 domain-containing protein [Bacteroidales bacterium]